MTACVFCDASNAGTIKLFENDFFFSIFDENPVSAGHSLIIPKRHVVYFVNLDNKEWSALKEAISKTIEAIGSADLKSFYSDKRNRFCENALTHAGKKPDGYNFGVNDGRAAGRTIDHVHIHVIPRYSGDVENPRGGVRNIITGMGGY